ncbi:MAG: hypothetical protein QXQ40_01505 [Candidatus Aenigmatarchaeota archaeon]
MYIKKGQMSLEIIIGLLILLVVAAVVISMFLSRFKKFPTTEEFLKEQEFTTFKNKCKQYCSEFMSTGDLSVGAQYCIHRLFRAGSDKFGNKGMIDIITIADGFPLTEGRPVCEDAIFCFHIEDCSEYGEPIRWDNCRQILCRYFYKTYNDEAIASQKVLDVIPDAGGCHIEPEENWWQLYFGENPCSGIS